jgi:hypothetical protein
VRAHFVFAVATLATLLAGVPARADSAAPPSSRWREASLAEYRQHLLDLDALVDSCAKARDIKTCDPTLVGLDDRVPLSNAASAERRLVRYGWLRVLLSKAQDKDAAAPDAKAAAGALKSPVDATTRPPHRTTSELLQDARSRLTQDLAQADGAASAPPPATADRAPARESLKQVLAGRDFRNLEAPNARDAALEKLGAWLNLLFESIGRLQARSAWLGRAVVWGFILAVCVGLAWGLLQMERRWRIRLVPESSGPAAGAASARDWQLWLKDARRAAGAGQWREAVHFMYWASISRLESRRLWPADRARTPREYLALVAPDDPRRPGLSTLTRSFERIWYGGRPAAEADYLKAEELATSLIEGGAR